MPDPATVTVLPTPEAIAVVVVGIFSSIVVPIAVRTLKKPFPGLEAAGEPPTWKQRLLTSITRYLGPGMTALGYVLAAVIVAGFLVAFFDLHFYTHRDAMIAGFAWESLWNKAKESNSKDAGAAGGKAPRKNKLINSVDA